MVDYLTNNWIFKSTATTAMEGFGERFGLNSRLTQNNRVIIPYLLEIFDQFKLFLELEIHVLVWVTQFDWEIWQIVQEFQMDLSLVAYVNNSKALKY